MNFSVCYVIYLFHSARQTEHRKVYQGIYSLQTSTLRERHGGAKMIKAEHFFNYDRSPGVSEFYYPK